MSTKHQLHYQLGDKIGGRYLVHQALLGGMGEVYLCLDLKEMQPFALKTFQARHLTDLQRLRNAFNQEVATWVSLEKHPNIVQCFLVETYEQQPFMILEWIFGDQTRGADLRGWLHHGALDWKFALEVVIDICRGLQHAQAKQPGIVHRDLKPENILITQKGVAKITDFGLAQITQSVGLQSPIASGSSGERQSLVLNNCIVGTPAYMAPEQWRGEVLDVRTDIYALGCVLYELLTGVSPFQVEVAATMRQSPQAWLRAMQNAHEHSVVTQLQTFLPKALNELVQRCLAKAPHDRYATPSDLMAQLVRIYQAHCHQSPPTRPGPGAFTAIDHHNRGLTFAALQQYQAALADFNAVIKHGLQDAFVYYNRGLTYHALQQQQAALADFNHAIALDPTLADAYANRGVIYAALQQPQAAMADYNRAIALNPEFATAYSNRGNLHRTLQHYQTALADFTQAIHLDPNNAIAHCNRGVTYAELSQNEEALADFTQSIHLDPNLAKAYYNRASLYDDLGQRHAAFADYTQAIHLDPTDGSAYLNIGVLLVNQRQLAEALSYFEKAAQLGQPRAAQYAAQVRQVLSPKHK